MLSLAAVREGWAVNGLLDGHAYSVLAVREVRDLSAVLLLFIVPHAHSALSVRELGPPPRRFSLHRCCYCCSCRWWSATLRRVSVIIFAAGVGVATAAAAAAAAAMILQL